MWQKRLFPTLIGVAAAACSAPRPAQSPEVPTPEPAAKATPKASAATAALVPEAASDDSDAAAGAAADDSDSAAGAASDDSAAEPGVTGPLPQTAHRPRHKHRSASAEIAGSTSTLIPGAAQLHSTGVLECDNYLQAVQTCAAANPAIAAAVTRNLTRMRNAWASVAAAGPTAAQALAEACQSALQQLPSSCVP